MNTKTDVSGNFKFTEASNLNGRSITAEGELGVPGKVLTHRDAYAQKGLSAGTGEHAGHLIAIRFGAPGHIRNMGLQNPNMNSFAPKDLQNRFVGPGGSYYLLEEMWSELLKANYKITVKITDKYKKDSMRPFVREVEWQETTPAGKVGPRQFLTFGNFSSPQKESASSPVS